MELNRIEQTRLRLIKEGKKIINLSSGNPGEFGIIFPKEILAKAFQNFQNQPVYSPDPKGNFEARRAIADFYATHGSTFFPAQPAPAILSDSTSPLPAVISPDNILLTSGTSESYLHLFKLLARPGDEILFPNPSYPLFDHLAQLANINLNHYFLDVGNNWQIDLKNLESKISAKTKAIVLISPNNPTGSVLTGQSLNGVLSIAQKYQLPIISDEVFHEFCSTTTDPDATRASATSPESALASAVTIFTLNGISKTYALPGLKLSWIVANFPNSPSARREGETSEESGFASSERSGASQKSHLELSIDTLLACNQISQAMLPTIIKEGENFLQTFKTRVQKSREIAIRTLSKNQNISFIKPTGGFYLFAEIKNFNSSDHTLDRKSAPSDEEFVIQIMEHAGIFVHPGYFYDYEKGLHVLISCLMEASELETVLEKFIQATADLCKY